MQLGGVLVVHERRKGRRTGRTFVVLKDESGTHHIGICDPEVTKTGERLFLAAPQLPGLVDEKGRAKASVGKVFFTEKYTFRTSLMKEERVLIAYHRALFAQRKASGDAAVKHRKGNYFSVPKGTRPADVPQNLISQEDLEWLMQPKPKATEAALH